MYLDAQTLLSDAQAFTGAAVSTNSYNLGTLTTQRELAIGEPMGVGIGVDVAASATTVLVELIQATDAALTAGIVVLAQRTFLAADMPVGRGIFFPYPENPTVAGPLQFLGIRVTPAGGAATVTLTAWITAQSLFSVTPGRTYAKGYTITG